jgi:hypothetical protein
MTQPNGISVEKLKDRRIVVRVDESTVKWLNEKAEKEDCSVGRIIRLALRKAKESKSFDVSGGQQLGLFNLAA